MRSRSRRPFQKITDFEIKSEERQFQSCQILLKDLNVLLIAFTVLPHCSSLSTTPAGIKSRMQLSRDFLTRKLDEYEMLKMEIEELRREIGPHEYLSGSAARRNGIDNNNIIVENRIKQTGIRILTNMED